MSSRLEEHGVEPWEDADLPLELKRAFGAYGEIGPDAASRAALLARLMNAPPAVSEAARPWLRRGLYLLLLTALGALWWTTRAHGPSAHVAVTTSARAQITTRAPAPALVTVATQEEPVSEAQPAEAERRDKPRAADKPGRVARSSATRPAALVAPRVSAPEQELALLVRAKQVMAGDALLALSLTDEHQTRFPHGTFAEEREVLAIEALMRAGQSDRARQRALAFRGAHPDSTHLDRLRVVLREP